MAGKNFKKHAFKILNIVSQLSTVLSFAGPVIGAVFDGLSYYIEGKSEMDKLLESLQEEFKKMREEIIVQFEQMRSLVTEIHSESRAMDFLTLKASLEVVARKWTEYKSFSAGIVFEPQECDPPSLCINALH